jgi:hypothetical protein
LGQRLERVAEGHPAHVQLRREIPLRRQSLALLDHAEPDRSGQSLERLLERRAFLDRTEQRAVQHRAR